MKKVFWLLLLIPLIQACATHAPMSEMVMFNTRIDTTSGTLPEKGGGLTIYSEKISNEQFEKKREGEFSQSYLIEEPVSLSIFKMKRDDFGLGVSLFHSFGIDVTKKIMSNSYITATASANQSFKFILQNKIISYNQLGMSVGFFVGRSYRGYENYSDCLDDEPCGSSVTFGPSNYDYLKIAGLRTRFILRSGQETGVALTGLIEFGRLYEIDDNFLSLGVSFIGF